eukprot:Awhi_evm1s709
MEDSRKKEIKDFGGEKMENKSVDGKTDFKDYRVCINNVDAEVKELREDRTLEDGYLEETNKTKKERSLLVKEHIKVFSEKEKGDSGEREKETTDCYLPARDLKKESSKKNKTRDTRERDEEEYEAEEIKVAVIKESKISPEQYIQVETENRLLKNDIQLIKSHNERLKIEVETLQNKLEQLKNEYQLLQFKTKQSTKENVRGNEAATTSKFQVRNDNQLPKSFVAQLENESEKLQNKVEQPGKYKHLENNNKQTRTYDKEAKNLNIASEKIERPAEKKSSLSLFITISLTLLIIVCCLGYINFPRSQATIIPLSELTKQLSLTFGEDILYTFPSKAELRTFTLASNNWPMKISNSEVDAILLAGMEDLAQLDSKFEDAISTMETRLESFYKQISNKVVSEWEKEKIEKAQLPIGGGMLEGLETSTKVKDQILLYVNSIGDTLVEMKTFLSLLNETLARPKTYCNIGEKKDKKVGGDIQQVLICPKELTTFLNSYYTTFLNYLIDIEKKLPQVKAFKQSLIKHVVQVQVSFFGEAYFYPYENVAFEEEVRLMDSYLLALHNANLKFSDRRQ